MIVTIQPSQLSGNIQAPASKSSMQRACAAALLKNGETIIKNPGHSNDDKASLGVIKDMGAVVESLPDGSIKVKGHGVDPIASSVNCGESGLGIRLFAPLIGLSPKTITIEGKGSLLNRPMDFFDEVFPQLGIKVRSNHGKLPLQLTGPLQPSDIAIDGSLSSQFLTGLLFAYASAGANNKTIKVKGLKSRPYIDLTLKVMKDFNMHVPENRNYESFYYPKPNLTRNNSSLTSYTVEGDWSGGAFLLVAGAIAGPITIHGLDPQSTQADKEVLQALISAGASLSIKDDSIDLHPTSLKAFQFDASDCPDLFPPLVALASYCKGTSVIQGVQRLTHKESNRALTLQDEFGKMGVEIDLQGDLMLIKGSAKINGANTHSRHDHRIAMACAVAALRAEGESVVEEAQAVDKSYPDFFADMQSLGAKIKLMQLS